MTVFLFILLGLVVLYFLGKKKASTKAPFQPGAAKHEEGKAQASKAGVTNGRYHPEVVHRVGVQALETVSIIGTSKALDTIKGRYALLRELCQDLASIHRHPRYVTDVQVAIDRYKAMYYDRLPNAHELALLLKPQEFNLPEFYCQALSHGLRRGLEDQAEEIKLLKREDAKTRRKAKMMESISTARQELQAQCAAAPSFEAVMAQVEELEAALAESGMGVGAAGPALASSKIQAQAPEPWPARAGDKGTQAGKEYVLNPGKPFALTLVHGSDQVARTVRKLLEEEEGQYTGGNKLTQLASLFAEHNLRVKEVETYKAKYGPVYLQKLEELRRNSAEWQQAGPRDREDLEEEFRQVALGAVYEQADCDLRTLFEKEPHDITFDDELIKEFGFDNMRTYLRFADNLQKVRVLQSDNYNRPKFEKLVELGLAVRGSAIPVAEILSTLTLKDLNQLAQPAGKEFKRKNLAIDHICTLPNLEELVGEQVSLRELFKLQPLPEKYRHLNLQELADSWAYTFVVVELLVQTFRNSNFAVQTLQDKAYVKHYLVHNWKREDALCPRARELRSQIFPKASPPMLPCHVGCNCVLKKEYTF
ncbi:hypothetical protein [Rufibacter sp. LB8]|uniref:hypothetical protein n=1 Tax=Rufibacter sp. LB8 TaxID=2777781 RepID=UPI00178C2CFC|nr:hypothetical protein [Rufibacter sp. LB8]